MNTYESLYIIDKDVTDEGKQAVIDKLSAAVTSAGGEVLNVDKWGMRKYAYPINFKTAASIPAELDRLVRIMDETVRIMTVRK